jgi:glycerol uptake facilitator-like aquaporin
MIWTFLFTLVYLALTTKDSYFAKSNIILRGLGVSYALFTSYLFCSGAGNCLNTAVGLSQSTYMVIYDYSVKERPSDVIRNNCMLVYIFAPLVGGILAAYASHYHE